MDIVLRGIVIFFFLYVLMRIIGRRELSSLEPFDLILLIVLGDAVQQGLTQDDYSVTGALLALFNVFGQRPETSRAASSAATLKVYAPSRLRGGLIYMARFTITAQRELKQATLVLDPGWAESITINTIEPSPVGEASANGSLSFELGHIPSGERYRLFMEFQVNPTNVGSRAQDVQLLDGDTPILTIRRSVVVYP